MAGGNIKKFKLASGVGQLARLQLQQDFFKPLQTTLTALPTTQQRHPRRDLEDAQGQQQMIITKTMAIISPGSSISFALAILSFICSVRGFTIPPFLSIHSQRKISFSLSSQKDLNNPEPKRGYQFGDLTKAVFGSKVEKLTGKPYQFGDLSRKINSSIKESINSLTGQDDYQFGDLSRYVDSQIKKQVNKFTNKERYEFGDLTREIVRRVSTGEYTLDDLFLLLKALAVFEASISPVAGLFPVKLLIELLNFSLANDVVGRVSSALAMELDRRLKKEILGNENYVMGDATKRTIANAVGAFTGKGMFEIGHLKMFITGLCYSIHFRLLFIW